LSSGPGNGWNLAINDCVFLQNHADRGGGLYVRGGFVVGEPRTEIRGTLFEGNTAAIFAGGMNA